MDQDVINLAKSISTVESNNNFNAKGKSGESGVAQWMPETWKAQAKSVLGDENAQMTPENQKAVLYVSLKKDKDAGLNPAQIAAKWNSGSPDNWEHKSGTNSKGVAYNVPAYVKKVTENYQQIKGSQPNQSDSQGYQTTPSLPAGTGKAPEQADQGFLGNVASDVSNRIKQGAGAISGAVQGKINPLSGILQTAGAGAGAISDVLNEGLKVIPGVKQGEELLGKGVGALAQTGLGQKISGGIQGFTDAHPELSADIGAVGNIASLIPIGKGIGIAGKAVSEGIQVAKAGAKGALMEGALGKTVADKVSQSALKEAVQIAAPKETKGVVTQGIKSGNTTKVKGFIQNAVNPQVERDAQELLPLVKNGLKATDDVEVQSNAIHDEIVKSAEEVKNHLNGMDVVPVIQPDKLNEVFKTIQEAADKANILTGNAGEKAKQLLQEFQSYLPKGRDITPIDVLNARQKLDSFIKDLGRGKAFDPTTENAVSAALSEVRHGVNNLLYESVPDLPIKKLIDHQSALYRILKNVADKGYKEVGSTRLDRFKTRHPIITGALGGAKKAAITGVTAGLGLESAQKIFGD